MTTENKLIFEHNFDEGAVKVSVDGDTLKIGDLAIEADHDQDCCESVYADLSVFDLYAKELANLGIHRLEIKAVEDVGLLFFFYDKPGYSEPRRVGVLVNCYNEQNGYYSSNLELVIRKDGSEQKIDVSEVVYDMID